VAAAATIGVTSAQAQEMCSCSPTVFTFTLSLDQTCEDNTIEGNPGIDGSFCFTEDGVAIPEPPVPEEAESEDGDVVSPSTRNSDIESGEGYHGYGDGPVRKLQDTTADTIAADDKVIEIVSVQFLQFDTSGDLTVINQDDTYADVSLSNGDQLKFYSASSFLDTSLPLEDQMSSPALVPGGASLIIYGKTESGVVVRNRFFWMYDMNCGNDNSPVNVDDKIGWVKVSEVANAWPTFCPALPAGSPTISPRSNEPTLTPSKSPTLNPSNNPTLNQTNTWGGDGHNDKPDMEQHESSDDSSSSTSGDVIHQTDTSVHGDGDSTWGGGSAPFSKSSKQTKTQKPGKASKSGGSKSSKSKSSKGGDHGSGWKGAATNVQGYTVSSSVTTRSGLALIMSLVMAAGALLIC